MDEVKPFYKHKTTRGRKPGIPNKFNREIKDMILYALTDRGGWEYLARQAEKHPPAFMGLIAKIIPQEVKLQAKTEHTFVITPELMETAKQELKRISFKLQEDTCYLNAPN